MTQRCIHLESSHLVSREADWKTVFTGITRKQIARMWDKNELDQKHVPWYILILVYILLSQVYCNTKLTYNVKLKCQIFVRVSKQDVYYNFTLSTMVVISVKSALITFFQHLYARAWTISTHYNPHWPTNSCKIPCIWLCYTYTSWLLEKARIHFEKSHHPHKHLTLLNL